MAIRTVILPLDFSSGAAQAVLPAGAVAERFGARVLPVSSRFGWGDKDPARELMVLTEAIRAVTDPPLVFDRFAPTAIAEVARTRPDSLVCMTTRGHDGLARLTGSVAEDVLHHVHAPVLLVGPASATNPTSTQSPVLICVDGSRVSDAIVAVAMNWLRSTRQAARLVRVVRHDDDAEAGGTLLAALAAELNADLADRVSWTVLRHDEVAPGIVEFARHEHVPLIAMATHGRTGLGRLILGSVTARVVHDAPCPVLTVRPVGMRQGINTIGDHDNRMSS